MNRVALQSKDNAVEGVLYMAMELSDKCWKLVFSDGGEKRRHETMEAGHRMELVEAIRKAKEKFDLSSEAKVVSCYEAGRDGFWLHRYLVTLGVENQVVDSSSIETNRRKRRAKTDRIDGVKLLTMLMRYWGGERGLWSVVRVPSVEDEEGRRLHRELGSLQKERTRHRNRIRGLLVAQGLRLEPNGDFLQRLEALTLWDGAPLPLELKGELEREYQRLRLVEAQRRALEKTRTSRLRQADTASVQRVVRLMGLRAIGPNCAWLLVMEFFAWRGFRNRRQLGACAGLTGTPYDSGGSKRDQGISKAGNRRVRTMMVEIAWLWLRYQPSSKLSRWFRERFAGGGARMRRVGIVALARRLLVALWRYLEDGMLPEGAELKAAG
ncbi:MAG: IS110 family transposase [Pseudomonadota bacterium]|nr:IS110 family transposase [Pseudomonadota bacterium]